MVYKTTYNLVSTLASSFLIGSSLFLQVWRTRTTIISQMSSKFGRIRPQTVELAALERLKKNSHTLIMGKNFVSTLEPLFLIGLNIFISLHKYNIQYMKTYMMTRIRTKANSL